MIHRNLLKSSIVIWFCILIFPPLGIVLLWMRRDSHLWTKLAGSLVAILFGLAHLVLFWNLRIELDGSTMRPIFSFKNPDKHNEELERFQAIEGKTWNIPAIAEGRLIVRNTTEMACFKIASGGWTR